MTTTTVHKVAEKALKTSFGKMNMEDIIFTGILRLNSDAGSLIDAKGVCTRAFNEPSFFRPNTDAFTALKNFYESYCFENHLYSCLDLSSI